MAEIDVASARTKRMDQWMVALDPSLRAVFGDHAEGGFVPNGDAVLDPAEEWLHQSVAGGAHAQAAASGLAHVGAAPPGGKGPVQIGGDVEVLTKEFKPYSTKYGDLKVSVTIKVSPIVYGAGTKEPIVATTTVTSKDKSKGRESGIKENFSYKDIADRELFDGFDIASPYISAEIAFSGVEVTISCVFAGTIVTKAFQAPAKASFILVKAKEGEGIQAPGIEIKIAPVSFKHKLGAVESGMVAEFKASFAVDLKKVGALIGKEVLKKLAKDAIKREAEKQGVKIVGREVAELVLRDLGPIAFAFGVGLDIGEVLNTYTIAPDMARLVDETILGNLPEEYQKAGTFRKIVLIHVNLPRIAAALVVSGVVGTIAGVTDLMVIKLLRLDTAAENFAAAFALFNKMLENVPNIGEAAGDMMASAVITTGIKLNPRHHAIADPSFAALASAVYAAIHPLYQAKNGLQKILDLHVKDVDVPEAALTKIVAQIFKSQWNYAGRIDLTDDKAVLDSFLELGLSELLGFLEANKLISYKVKLSPELGLAGMDQSLVDELFL